MAMQEVPNVLAIDVGNTRVRLASVKGEAVTDPQAFSAASAGEIGPAVANLWQQMPEPRRVAASSVNATALAAVEQAVAEAIDQDVLVVGRDLPLPIDADLPHPESVGTDRLCAAAAAFDRLGTACVVADCGTAITVDCVDGEGRFLGGAILPGLAMGASALAAGTARLTNVQPRRPDWVFGKDTEQAIIGGLVFSARGALRMLTEAYATELGHWPLLILTGGDAELIAAEDTDVRQLVRAFVPDLSLRGVAMAYYRLLLGPQ